MDYITQANAHQIVVETLKELGIPDPRISITDTTILVQDGCYVGRSLVCCHVRVIMRPGGERIEFFDQQGSVLRVIHLPDSAGAWNRAA